MDDHEEFERVPWSDLTAAASPSRSRPLYLAAALVGAIVIGVLAGRILGKPAGDPAAPGASVIAKDAGDETSTSSVPDAPSAAIPPGAPGLYSEADLMAVPSAGPEMAAAARAEWFVTDYFTADMEPTGSADVLGALPAGADLPAMPQETVASISYVEWARTFRVDEVGDGLYRVGVAFRMLGAPPDRGFFRLAVRAVEVTVLVSPDGGTTVVELPIPVDLPTAPEPEPWPEPGDAEVPPGVVEQAASLARAWGSEPRLVSGQPIEGGWRVVMTLADEVGNRWPIAVRVDENGARLT